MREIKATFENGREILYTMAIFEELKNDKEVKAIIDAKTGEVLHLRRPTGKLINER